MNIEAFFNISYGLYILSSTNNGKFNGHINNTCFQVTAEPAKFAVCSHKDNLTTEYIDKSNTFAISIIQQDVNLNDIGHWGFRSGKDFDKFENINFKTSVTGAPIILDKTIAYIDCRVVEKLDVGTHIIFVGEVADAEILKKDTPALTYKYYRDIIKGLSPKNAPTFIAKDSKKVDEMIADNTGNPILKEYICPVCGYIYEPLVGDPTSGIKPGTPFEDLPDTWLCPVCGAEKDMFSMV